MKTKAAAQKIDLGTVAINPIFASTRPRVATPIERARMREQKRDTEDLLRQLEAAEKEAR